MHGTPADRWNLVQPIAREGTSGMTIHQNTSQAANGLPADIADSPAFLASQQGANTQ
jgi:hypothetical protein